MLHTAKLAGECSTTLLVAATSRTLLRFSNVTGLLFGIRALNSTLLLLLLLLLGLVAAAAACFAAVALLLAVLLLLLLLVGC
jgi:hypothetical protein